METDSRSTLRLTPDEWLDDPEAALAACREAVATGTVRVDASEARNLPAQIIQLLISVRRTVEAAGGTFALCNPSDEIKNSLKVLGLSDYFAEVTG
ncbi:STAS domain-containing protein [Donghicola sp. C2-DW-16]|uniref:STAS domain-containing protein n=1 Tax=Donghicola mangrovi TaxID=2729614 RepID=A0ABX2PGI5_9RHOB|nr:STAS domain-containing protein [Donghicola mangrovi]NVO28518.1 STAS domain-containing protein [Donghicola mangrovi]